jgi:hypothetical protein
MEEHRSSNLLHKLESEYVPYYPEIDEDYMQSLAWMQMDYALRLLQLPPA